MSIIIGILIGVAIAYVIHVDSVTLGLLEGLKQEALRKKSLIFEYYDDLTASQYYGNAPTNYRSHLNYKIREYNEIVDRYNNEKYLFQPKLNRLVEWK